jgi:hypothetical protein
MISSTTLRPIVVGPQAVVGDGTSWLRVRAAGHGSAVAAATIVCVRGALRTPAAASNSASVFTESLGLNA